MTRSLELVTSHPAPRLVGANSHGVRRATPQKDRHGVRLGGCLVKDQGTKGPRAGEVLLKIPPTDGVQPNFGVDSVTYRRGTGTQWVSKCQLQVVESFATRFEPGATNLVWILWFLCGYVHGVPVKCCVQLPWSSWSRSNIRPECPLSQRHVEPHSPSKPATEPPQKAELNISGQPKNSV